MQRWTLRHRFLEVLYWVFAAVASAEAVKMLAMVGLVVSDEDAVAAEGDDDDAENCVEDGYGANDANAALVADYLN